MNQLLIDTIPIEIFHYNIIPLLNLVERGHVVRMHIKYEEFLVKNKGCWEECFKDKFRIEVIIKHGLIRTLSKYENELKFNKYCLSNAASNGHLEVVKWLLRNRNEGCRILAIKKAAENGNLHIVKLLHENIPGIYSKSAMVDATENGQLDIVKYLKSIGY